MQREELGIFKKEKEPWNELEWRGKGDKIVAEAGKQVAAGLCRKPLEFSEMEGEGVGVTLVEVPFSLGRSTSLSRLRLFAAAQARDHPGGRRPMERAGWGGGK